MNTPTLNPETEREFDELEVVIKQQLNKYMGRILGDEKCRDGSYIPQPILDYVKQFIAKVEKQAITTTIERIEKEFEKLMDKKRAKEISNDLEMIYGERHCKICGTNPELQRKLVFQALSTLKQELAPQKDKE